MSTNLQSETCVVLRNKEKRKVVHKPSDESNNQPNTSRIEPNTKRNKEKIIDNVHTIIKGEWERV